MCHDTYPFLCGVLEYVAADRKHRWEAADFMVSVPAAGDT
jgi:hypothetical protein